MISRVRVECSLIPMYILEDNFCFFINTGVEIEIGSLDECEKIEKTKTEKLILVFYSYEKYSTITSR